MAAQDERIARLEAENAELRARPIDWSELPAEFVAQHQAAMAAPVDERAATFSLHDYAAERTKGATMILDSNGKPIPLSPADEAAQQACDHGVTFDEAGLGLSSATVRRQWPRLNGACPKGCGFSGIAYASPGHYIAGDW